MQALSNYLRPAACSSLPSRVFAKGSLRQAIRTHVAAALDAGHMQARTPAYSKFNIYKGKAALQLSMIGPKWKQTPTGSLYLDKEGAMFAEFANVNASSGQQVGYGDRSYNWEQKVVFALKSVELGHFLDDKIIKEQGISLYHDPDKGGLNEGVIKKTFAVKVNPDDSYMFSIAQTDKSGVKTNVVVPVTPAEMMIIRNLIQFSVPRLLGFDVVLDGIILAPSPSQPQ